MDYSISYNYYYQNPYFIHPWPITLRLYIAILYLFVLFNMIFDAVLLISLFIGLHYVKSKHPNFLFFPKGAALFLPPDINTQVKPKKKKEKVEQEVSVIKIQYEHVEKYPFVNEFSRVITTILGLTLFFAIRIIISFIYTHDSVFPFYTTALIFIYTVKLGIDTFFMTNYGRRNCFIIALGINLLFFLFFLAFGDSEGVFNRHLQVVVSDYSKHLSIIFNRQINFFTHKTMLIAIFVINFFIIIAIIPSIIKFGNWYAKTLKQTSYEEDDPTIAAVRREGGQQRDVKDQQKRLKQQSKKLINKLNLYLAFMLALQFFSHPYITGFLDQHLVFFIRTVCLTICIFIICTTMSNAIEFNGSFAYRYVLQFFQTEEKEKREELRKKIVPYIYYIWYHFFQFIIRIFIPLLLFLLVVNWRYIASDKPIADGPIANRQINPDIQCPIHTDQLTILQNLYKCSSNTASSQLQEKFFLSGIIQSIPKTLPSHQLQANIQSYGLVTRDLMVQFWQQLFWYSSLSIYLMTVVYILFLRKTVYDI